jgi:hypothetical protein
MGKHYHEIKIFVFEGYNEFIFAVITVTVNEIILGFPLYFVFI